MHVRVWGYRFIVVVFPLLRSLGGPQWTADCAKQRRCRPSGKFAVVYEVTHGLPAERRSISRWFFMTEMFFHENVSFLRLLCENILEAVKDLLGLLAGLFYRGTP